MSSLYCSARFAATLELPAPSCECALLTLQRHVDKHRRNGRKVFPDHACTIPECTYHVYDGTSWSAAYWVADSRVRSRLERFDERRDLLDLSSIIRSS